METNQIKDKKCLNFVIHFDRSIPDVRNTHVVTDTFKIKEALWVCFHNLFYHDMFLKIYL